MNEAIPYVREAAPKQSRRKLHVTDHGDSVMSAIVDPRYREYFKAKLAEMNVLARILAGK